MLCFNLATKNVRKNFKSFAPFLLSAVTMFVIIFVMVAIATSTSIYNLHGAVTIIAFLILGIVVLSIFTTWILIYSYRFLILQRSREFGLYHILGFEKKQVIRVALFELLISYVLTLITGIGIGSIFSKFFYLILVNLVGGGSFVLEISNTSLKANSFLYFVLFLILAFITSFKIWKFSSLDLFQEASKGEKEPKSNLFFAILSLVLLAIGYFIALTVNGVNLFLYFIAVLIVIFGTYFFYVSFTIWYLKQQKKRTSYYKINRFVSISSMLYRMRANAIGLGNITLLLSMSTVTLIVSLGLFMGHSARISSLGVEQIAGFVFIGFIIGFSFILGTALIVYYKQLSEGVQDRRSFEILQKVGLSKIEIHQTIIIQVRIVFFLPLLITFFHLLGAYKMVTNMFNVFGIQDNQFIFFVSLVIFLIISAFYYFVYKIMSKVYYGIVKK